MASSLRSQWQPNYGRCTQPSVLTADSSPSTLCRPQLRDPSDEMVLEAAVNGQASYLVTLNVRDFKPAASQWHLKLMAPGAFLHLLEKPS